MAIVNLSAPWVRFYKELQELFRGDNGIHVIYDEDQCEIRLYVDDSTKAYALSQLLPSEKEFGNVKLYINVIPGNKVFMATRKTNLFEIVFADNDALSYIRTVSGVMTNDITYIVFVRKVVQYFDDNLGDAHGVCSTLYQEIAKDVFGEHEGIFFCTDIEDRKLDNVSAIKKWP